MKYFFSLLLCVAASSAFAQFVPGYVVLQNNDTVRGFVADKIRFEALKALEFKKEKEGAVENYNTKDLKWVVLTGSDARYKSVFVTIDKKPRNNERLEKGMTKKPADEQLLIELLVAGKLDLYKYTDESHDLHFFFGDGDTVSELNFVRYYNELGVVAYFEEYKQQLKNAFADCAEKTSLPYNFSTDLFVTAFKKYNQCASGISYTKTRKLKLTAGISVGAAFTNVKYQYNGQLQATEYFGSHEYKATVTPTVGIVLHLVSTTKKDPVIPVLKIGYGSTGKFSSTSGDKYAGTTFNYDLRASYVAVDIGARFVFLRYGKVRPYVTGMVGSRIIVNQEAKVVKVYDNPLETSYTGSLEMARRGFALTGGAGVSIDHFDLEVGYTMVKFDEKFIDAAAKFKTTSIAVIYKPFK